MWSIVMGMFLWRPRFPFTFGFQGHLRPCLTDIFYGYKLEDGLDLAVES